MPGTIAFKSCATLTSASGASLPPFGVSDLPIVRIVLNCSAFVKNIIKNCQSRISNLYL